MSLFMFPGMGATGAMYGGAWRDLPGVRFLDWPAGSGAATLREIAEAVVRAAGIGAGDAVGGTSLGGMVALEAAAVVQARAVFLVGSAVSREEIHPLLVQLAPLAEVTPLRLVQVLAGSSGQLGRLFAATDAGFIRESCKALARWEGAPPLPGTALHRLHGERDHVIPCPPGCTAVRGAGHLVAMTHAGECARWVAARLPEA